MQVKTFSPQNEQAALLIILLALSTHVLAKWQEQKCEGTMSASYKNSLTESKHELIEIEPIRTAQPGGVCARKIQIMTFRKSCHQTPGMNRYGTACKYLSQVAPYFRLHLVSSRMVLCVIMVAKKAQ